MAEKPEECSQCSKPNHILYKEIIGECVISVEMCAECPILQRRLHAAAGSNRSEQSAETEMGVCCGSCGTTMLAVRTGDILGCPECYSVFEEVLVQELLRENIPERVRKMQENTKKPYLHVGKTPVQEADISSASRIVNLNEALKEALNKENYEQAAWLRDQIKALTDKKQASDL